MNARPVTRRGLRLGAVVAVGALLVSALTVAAQSTAPAASAAASAAVAPPAGAELFRVSQNDTGASTEPSLTPDGQRVAFASTAGDLVPGDGNGVSDIFLSVATPGSDDPFSSAPTLVSVPDGAAGGAQADGPSSEPVVSANGRYVAFTSAATNLVAAGGTSGRTSVYVRDTVLGTTFRVQGAAEPNGRSYDPDLSDSGRYLVFTSEATNLTDGDGNDVADAFLADLDANSDGILGDIALTRFLGETSMSGGSEQARISGNGASVVFTAHEDSAAPGVPAGSFVYYAGIDGVARVPSLLGSKAHSPTIDATGRTFAYIGDEACNGDPAVVAVTADGSFYYASVGTQLLDTRVGYVADPVISGNGSTLTWTTTVPPYDFSANATELATPVVRQQAIRWFGSKTQLDCTTSTTDWIDLAEGAEASVSASGRTVAYRAPSPADATVFALDTHSNSGLSVTDTQGQLVTPGFMTQVDVPTIPLTSLRGYASAIANAPIHNLPIHNLPIHNLPIHNLPIHNLPIHNLPIHNLPIHNLPIHNLELPGGWEEVLAGSPFAGELIQSVTLDRVLTWAADALATGSTATDAERAAAERIQSLTLGDLDVDESALAALTLASYVLGSASLGDIPIPGEPATEPAPGEEPPTLSRWQDVVKAQGFTFTVESDWYLADLDAAGVDIERTRVDEVPLRALPVPRTLMRFLDPSELFLAGTPLGDLDVSTLDEVARVALFGDAHVSGALAGFSGAFLPDATVADLAAGAPEWVTLGILLMSMLDEQDYPWEQISPSSLDPNLIEASTAPIGCTDELRCTQSASFQYTFDPGPGEPARFAAPTATLATPAGTVASTTYVWASGPDGSSTMYQTYPGPKQVDGERTHYPLAETAGGTVLTVLSYYSPTTQPGESRAVGTLTSGALTASDELFGGAPLSSFDDPSRNLSADGQWEAPPTPLVEGQISYEWISPQYRQLDDEGRMIEGPAEDSDYYLVKAPAAGKRLVVSTNATDGQISMSLYAPAGGGAPLGVASAGPAPGVPVAEQSGPAGSPSTIGADAGVPLDGRTLVDQTVVGGDGAAQIEAASTDASPGTDLLVRVTSGNGLPSASLYSLRIQYLDDAPDVQCTPWTAPQRDDPGIEGVSDPVTNTTNTVYLFDEKRFGDVYGRGQAADVRDALVSLTGDGHVGDGAVDGAVLAIDSDEGVRTARAALDANPCSMPARSALTAAINAFVGSALGDQRSHISSVVVVGGDDIVPLAPVAQNTSQFTEVSHADDLRRPTQPDGSACPVAAAVDPCETPLSAAARTSHILTDDPYGLAKAYDTLGGHLYVPSVALGRLVETPAQIEATISRFLDSDGRLAADSTVTGGYGAWSELPQKVTQSLAWRSAVNNPLGAAWTAADMEDTIFATGDAAPRVVSVNTHADERRMLPGVPGAESGSFSQNELFLAQGHENAPQLAGALIFGIGCHAGNNLPSAYYGDVTDWVDVFSQAGGYIGNTGYGLANSVSTALSARLLTLYADWVGVSVGGRGVSSAEALTYAKQSYIGGLGLYSGYDEKALMEAVYYGLPMYTFTDPVSTELPLPEMPALTISKDDALTTASLSFTPTFTPAPANDAGTSLTVDGQAQVVVPGQPILPSIVRRLEPQAGLVPRGVVLTDLTSQFSADGTPAVATASVGVPEATASATDAAFPSSFGTITHQDTPAGPVDLLVLTPARVEIGQGGRGRTETFTDFTAEVVYGDPAASDATPPAISTIDPVDADGKLSVFASDPGSGVAAVIVLVQPEGQEHWQRLEVTSPPADGRRWTATPPAGPFRWMVQVVDGAGNVATDTARGRLAPAQAAAAPVLGEIGAKATVAAGARIRRAVAVTDAAAGEHLTASTALTDPDGAVVSRSPATVETGPDGTTRALIDQVVPRSGAFTLTLTVCRGDACTDASLAVETPAPNAVPTASVALTSDTNPVEPTSVLTAHAQATDPDHDPVSVSYTWSRNGVVIRDQMTQVLDLAGIAETGDVIRVTATPDDGSDIGHAASAEVVVGDEVVAPAAPTITATATTAAGPYPEGEWSRTPVTVTFDCTGGAPFLMPCPVAQTVSADTSSTGTAVAGSVTDLLGRTATASVLVKVDGTAPGFAPVITPAAPSVGEVATATPNATDASSGVASQSCDVPDTATAGAASVTCRAADVAGNTAEVQAHYTVVAVPDPGPDPTPDPDPDPTPEPNPTPPVPPAPSPTPPVPPRATPDPGPPATAAPRTGTGRGNSGGLGAPFVTPARPLVPVGVVLPDRQPLGPLAADGSSVFARGSGVPIIFRAYGDDGLAIGTEGYVTGVVLVTSAALPATASVSEGYFLAFPFVYADAPDLWLGSIPTADLKGGQRYTYRVELSDGTSFTVTFGVR